MWPGHLRHRSIGGLNGVLSAKCSQPVVVVGHRERRETSFLPKWLHQTSVHVQEFLWLNSHLRCLHQTLQVAHHHHGQGPGDEARGASPHRPVQRCHKPKCNWTIHSVRIRTVEASLTTRAVIRSAKLRKSLCICDPIHVIQFGLETGAASLERPKLSRSLPVRPPVRPFSFPHAPVREQHRHGREKEAGLFRHLRLRQGRGGRWTASRATGGTRSPHCGPDCGQR